MSDTKIIAPDTNKVAPENKAGRPTWKDAGKVHAGEQPFTYPLKREFVEPEWRRLPGYRSATREEWETALWQRRHTVKNLKELKQVFGALLPATLMASLERDIKERATMSILVPPHMLNTMDEKDLWNDPVRRYMLPAFDDRHPEWPSHPKASRDSLHETDMWAVEGLTHRYPTKVLAELLSTCPPYCGHCTRMDLVGNDVPLVVKLKFQIPPEGSLPADAGLSARDAFRARRCGQRRRHCQHAHRHAGGVLLQADGSPEHQGHSPGHERLDRHPAAFFENL